MKKAYLISVFIGLLGIIVAGCSSSDKPRNNISRSGASSGSEAIYKDMGAFAPDPGYDPNVRSRNNYIVLSLNIAAFNTKTTLLPDNINGDFMWMTLQNNFEASKRFSVISKDQPEKAKNASLKLRAEAQVVFSEMENKQKKAVGCEIKMAFVGVNSDGVQEFDLNAFAKEYVILQKSFTGKYTVDGQISDQLISNCVTKCFDTVYPALCKRYPISGNAESARYNSKNIFLMVDRGSEDGVQMGMPFVIGYTDADGNEIFVARGSAKSVQKTKTQIILDQWNSDEPEGVELWKSKIAANDKAFIENVFVVSKYRDAKKEKAEREKSRR